MFLRDACDQPVSSAWIGSICSHVALEKWSWHPCSPVSPPSSGQCSCWSSSPPAPVHSRLCVTVLPTLHPRGISGGPLLLPGAVWHWIGQKESNQLAALSVPIFSCVVFPLVAVWLDPFTPPTSQPVAEISSHPASAPAIFCWRVPFFVVLQKVLLPRWTLPYTLIFQQMKERATL